MHTFPGLNSIFSLPVVVVVCLYAHVIGVTCTGKSGWGIGDRGCGTPFWGEGGGCVEGTNVITGHKCNKGNKCNNIWSQM